MIEVTQPDVPVLAIKLVGDDVRRFREMIYDLVHGNLDSDDDVFANEIWMAL